MVNRRYRAPVQTGNRTTLSTRFSDEELRILRDAAEKRKWSLSQYIHECVCATVLWENQQEVSDHGDGDSAVGHREELRCPK